MESTLQTKNSFAEKFRMILFHLENYSILVRDIFLNIPTLNKKNWKNTVQEMYEIGTQALVLSMLGGCFSGIILSIEGGHNLQMFGAILLIGKTISLGITREVGPVTIGLLLAARTGAKNASELGSMQISEQIDALLAFGYNPVEKLVLPRIIAALVMFLPLTLIADLTGIISGMFITNLSFHVDLAYFWSTAIKALRFKDLFVGFLKPVFFSFFIASISCYFGLYTRGGTKNLGKNTITAVVVSTIAVLFLDFVFTKVVWEIM